MYFWYLVLRLGRWIGSLLEKKYLKKFNLKNIKKEINLSSIIDSVGTEFIEVFF
jgi:hypothetical protein